MNEQLQDTLRDIVGVLDFVIKRTQIETTDSIRAAVARLQQSMTTDDERKAQRLSYLKTRRGQSLPERSKLLDKKMHLDRILAQYESALAVPEEKLNRGEQLRLERERVNAKRPADAANKAYQDCITELAAIEAEIAALETTKKAA
jgi:hypothetical protein